MKMKKRTIPVLMLGLLSLCGCPAKEEPLSDPPTVAPAPEASQGQKRVGKPAPKPAAGKLAEP